MGIQLGSSTISDVYLGNTLATAIYIGNDKVWPTTQFNFVTNGLILYFNFAESSSYSGTGTSIFDLSGNNYTGTLDNQTYATYNSTTKSMDFTGLVANNSTISTGSHIGWGTGASLVRTSSVMSYGAFLRLTSLPFGSSGFRWSCFSAIDNFNIGANARKFAFYFFNSSGSTTVAPNLSCDYFNGSGGATSLVSTSSNFIGQDLYIVTTIEQGTNTAKLYINGSLVDTKNGIQPNINPSTSANFNTGRVQSSFPGLFAGKMYTQHAYNRILSQAEITENYNFLKNQFGL